MLAVQVYSNSKRDNLLILEATIMLSIRFRSELIFISLAISPAKPVIQPLIRSSPVSASCFRHLSRKRLSVLSLKGCSLKLVVWRAYWNLVSNIKVSMISSSVRPKSSLSISAPTMIFTGVLGREDDLSLYNTAKAFSSIFGKILSAKGFAHDLSRNLLSLAVSDNVLSSRVIWF